MKEACKFFSLLILFNTYQELKKVSAKSDMSISALIRRGIDLVLENKGSRKVSEGDSKE